VRDFDRVVETFVGTMVSVRRQNFDRFDITAQFVSYDHPRFAKFGNQPFEEALCSFGVSASLHENVERVAICGDRAPQPVLLATDHDHDFVHVPLVIRPWTIAPDAICKVSTKAIDPLPSCFPADDYAPRS
jgi:hypothetical protein